MYKLFITYTIHAQGYAGDDFNDWVYDSFKNAYGDNDCKLYRYDNDSDYAYDIRAQITYKDKDGYTYYDDMDVDYND